MKKLVVITDLTVMRSGVCIAGIDLETKESIRPVLNRTIKEADLFDSKGQLAIYPKALMEFDFIKRPPFSKPHVEDYLYDPERSVSKGIIREADFGKILEKISYNCVEEIFDGFLIDRKYILPGSNTKSLGFTVCTKIVSIDVLEYERKKYRITFIDGSGIEYSGTITDLTFRKYYDKLSFSQRINLEKRLNKSLRIFIKMGLARPWIMPGSDEERCYLQINGIYTLPDYLEGKNFLDFE